MGFDYAFVHLKYTIPVAIALTAFYRPLFTRIDLYKVCSLVIIAVGSTTPWDSYLIRHRIWSYPPGVIYGPKLFKIPAEEFFFFIIQTYVVSLIYLILSKSTLHSLYLTPGKPSRRWKFLQVAGQSLLGGLILNGIFLWNRNGKGTYLGLILVWACPFLLLLWSLAYQFILALPFSNTLLPIAFPTVYLWIVDTFALQRGTWVIETGTKYEVQLWNGLDIEEAIFFFATNTLIVFGLVAFDNALAVLDSSCSNLHSGSSLPSPALLMKSLMLPNEAYDSIRILAIRQAARRLQAKSRSFYLASSTFEGTLRIDLILLYSFCRLADDLVDQADSAVEAAGWVKKLKRYVDIASSKKISGAEVLRLQKLIAEEFPPEAYSTLCQVPINRLSEEPLLDLLKGFELDLKFSRDNQLSTRVIWPIEDENYLEKYCYCVAGTVAELCLDLVFHKHKEINLYDKKRLKKSAQNMGKALQIVNIARDIAIDAEIGRVYIPSSWIRDEGLTPHDIVKHSSGPVVERLRSRLLDKAFDLYNDARGSMEDLPSEVRGPMRVAVDSYMEIGNTLRQRSYVVKAGRATVPRGRRLWVAWYALNC